MVTQNYDLNVSRRKVALEAGALEKSHHHMVEFMRNWIALKKAHEQVLKVENDTDTHH